jgi:hypothetical protein
MASSSSSCPNQQPIQSVSISESVEPSAEASMLTTAGTLMLTAAAPPTLVDQFHNEIERRLYFFQLLSWAGIHLPQFVISAMYENGMYVSFMKILEDGKRKDDAMRVNLAAEFMKYNTAHPKEDQDDDDDDDEEDEDEEDDEDEEEDSDDEDETGDNTEDVTNQTVKKQKVTHTNASTQTINESPITLDQSTST